MPPALSPRVLVALATLGSTGILAGALVFQAIGYAPCELCILQRWPHLAAAILGAALLALRLPRVLNLLGMAIMLVSTSFGLYHSGVERKIFAGPDSCTSNPIDALSAADLLAQIQQAPVVRCDEIVWDLFGVTMPNFNALFSLAFAGLWLMAFLSARKAR
ncbi:disulfide bond formation protein DsbB [Rhodobacter sp. JA431]|uniref:disulfide bond formation protein B n=1 Tax=Rhodobacter sp. JA431 TaxID=570013 RepID=UPI000BD54DDC|nr:disulfide bond formation protein B [Rhodobacter sp. JA431]SOC13891.1 disulfide bond formation protein DsbB [Rhodobacter sp. JA431]